MPLDMNFGLDLFPTLGTPSFSIPENDYSQFNELPGVATPPISYNPRNDFLERIADNLAGSRYYGVTPEDKDRALSMALMEMGGRLGAAAGAGSWTKACLLYTSPSPRD